MKQAVIVLAACSCAISVASCGSAPSVSPQEVEARQALDRVLLDGVSARLRDVKEVASAAPGGGRVLCGLVNSKNRLGAYTGWRRFLIERADGGSVVSPDAGDDSVRHDQASQIAFEAVYPHKVCPTNGYTAGGVIAEAMAANGIAAER